MYQLILMIHILLAIVLIGLVLVQRGKGASMGAAFGAGASGTVFGSTGSGSFLLKMTSVLAATFFITTLVLGYIEKSEYRKAHQINVPVPTTDQQGPSIPLPPDAEAPE